MRSVLFRRRFRAYTAGRGFATGESEVEGGGDDTHWEAVDMVVKSKCRVNTKYGQLEARASGP